MRMLESQVGTRLAHYNAETGIAIWWNGSATFNVWSNGHEVDVFTNYNAESWSFMGIAERWANEN